jgi:hypothetical protein
VLAPLLEVEAPPAPPVLAPLLEVEVPPAPADDDATDVLVDIVEPLAPSLEEHALGSRGRMSAARARWIRCPFISSDDAGSAGRARGLNSGKFGQAAIPDRRACAQPRVLT